MTLATSTLAKGSVRDEDAIGSETDDARNLLPPASMILRPFGPRKFVK